jgi:hypothetical protein
MTLAARLLLLLALLASLAVAGCGGDEEGKPIPSATANALEGELDGVQARLDNGSAGACKDILEGTRGPNMERVNELIGSLPDDVDPDVRSALEDSFDRLWDLVGQDCDDKASKEEQAQPEPEPETTETQTETTETQTETTETQPTTTEPTLPGEEELPPDGTGDGNGNGNNGNGVGNGGGAGPSGADLGDGE